MYILNNGIQGLGRWIRDELELESDVIDGSRGNSVKRVQEWLCLHNYSVVIDGSFGPVTETTVKRFQSDQGLLADGVVGPITYAALTAPMLRALGLINGSPGRAFGEVVVDIAKQHLKEHPLEIGGDNKGPWVRLYMKGNEGPLWFWCAGFTTFVMKQAAEELDVPAPIKGSFSCDSLAFQAKDKNRFLAERDVVRETIPPGSMFLVRRTSDDWTHCGIVIDSDPNGFFSIEGNTNDDGERNGYEVCNRNRAYPGRDFIVL